MEYESTEAKKLVSLLETSESQEKAYWLSRTRRAIVIWSIVFVLLALSVTFIVLGLSERSRYVDFKLHYIKYDDDEARSDIDSGMEDRRATIYDTIDNIAPPDNVEGYDFTGNYYNSSNYEVIVKPESNVKESLTYENSLYMQYELGHYKLTIETGVGSTERFETPEGAVGYNKLMFITPQDLQSSSANNFVGKWLDYNNTKSVTYVGNSLLNMYSLNNAVVARDNSTASGYRVQDYDGKSNNHIYGFKTNIGGKEVQYIITEAYYVNADEKPGDSGVTIRSTYLVEKKIGGETVLKNFANGYKPVFTKDKQGNETTVPEYEYYNGKYIYKARMENGKPVMIDITSEKENANAFRMPGKDTVVNVWWEADDRYVVIVDTVDEYSKNVIFGNKDNATILNNYNLAYDTVEGYITDARNNGENNDWTTLLDDYSQYDIDWSNAIVIPKDIGQNNVGTLVSSYVQDYSGKLSQKGTTGSHYYPVSKLGYNRNAWEIYSKDASGNWGWKRVEYDTNINSDINKEVCILIRPVWLVESVRYIYSVDSSSGTKINVNNSLSSYPGYGSASAQTYVAMKSAMVNANDNRYLVNSNADNIETVPVIERGGYSFVGWQIPSKYEMRYNNSIGVSNMGYADIVSSKGTTEYRNIIIEQPSIACQYAGVKSIDWKVIENGDWVKATSSNASNKNLYMGEATIEESGALVYYRFYYFGTYDQLTSDTQVITKIPYGYYVRTMETSSSGETVWKKPTEMRLSPVWDIIDYHITLDYNITTTNDGVEVKAQDELLLKNKNGEYVESAYGVLYGVRDYTKPTDPDNIVKEVINDINVETGFVNVYNIGNSITLPGTAQLYRRGYTLVGYDILEKVNNGNGESVWVKNEEKSKTVSNGLDASNIKINGTDGVVKDLYGDIVFKAIWQQKEYTTETKTTPSKDTTSGKVTLQGTTNIAYGKKGSAANRSTYVALLYGDTFSFADQSTDRSITTSDTIKANYNYKYHDSSEAVVYVRLNDYFSDSTFNINLQFSNIDCGLIGFDSSQEVITAQELFKDKTIANIADLNYTQSFTKSVNGKDLVIATINISIVKDGTEEYYKITFSNLACSVKFDLSEINYNLVESNILPNPNYYTNENSRNEKSRIENIESAGFVADNWYFLSDNISDNIDKIVKYNRVHANKIRYVITYDKDNKVYKVFDTTTITTYKGEKDTDLDKISNNYYALSPMHISYFDNALVKIENAYLSSKTLQSKLAGISLLDRAKLSTALLGGESKESNQYDIHNDNGAIKNTATTYISLQGASYKAKVSVTNDSNTYYKGLFNRDKITSSYLVTNATNTNAEFTTSGSDEYSTKFGTYAKGGETIGFVSKLPSMYINIQLFAEKDGTTNKADDDVKYTILNENDSELIKNITTTVGAGTTKYGRMLKFVTNSISAYDVVNGELLLNKGSIFTNNVNTYIPFTSSFIFKVDFSGKYAQFNDLTPAQKVNSLKSMFSGLDFNSENTNAYLVTYDNNYYIIVDFRKIGRLSEGNTTYIGKGNSEENSEENSDKGEILANSLEIYVSKPGDILNSFNLNFNNYVVGYNLDTTNSALLTTDCGWGNILASAGDYKQDNSQNSIFTVDSVNGYAQANGLYQGKNYEYKITLSAEYSNSPIGITISYTVGGVEYIKTISAGDKDVKLTGAKGADLGLTTTVSFVRSDTDSQAYILTINTVDTALNVSFNNIYRNMYGFKLTSGDESQDATPYIFSQYGCNIIRRIGKNSSHILNLKFRNDQYIVVDNVNKRYKIGTKNAVTVANTIENVLDPMAILQKFFATYPDIITREVLSTNYAIRLIYKDSNGFEQSAYFISRESHNDDNKLAIVVNRNIEIVKEDYFTMFVGNDITGTKLTGQKYTSSETPTEIDGFTFEALEYKLNSIEGDVVIKSNATSKINQLTINVGNGKDPATDRNYNKTIFSDGDDSQAYVIGSSQFYGAKGESEINNDVNWFSNLINNNENISNIRDLGYSWDLYNNPTNKTLTNLVYGNFVVLALKAKYGYNGTFNLVLKDTAGTPLVAITYNADPKSEADGNKTYYAIDKIDACNMYSAWDGDSKTQYVAVMLKDKDAINTKVDGSFTLDIVNPINVYSFKDETDSARMGEGYEFGISYNTDGSRVTDYYELNEEYEHGTNPIINFVLKEGYTQSDYAIDVYYRSVATTQSLIYKITSKYNTETKKYEPEITSPVTGIVMGCLVLSPKNGDTWSGFRFQIGNGLEGATGEIIFKVTQDLKLNKYNLTLKAEKTEGDTLAGGIEIEKLDTTKPMIATAIAGTDEDESFANGKNTYTFTHGNAITLTFRPHANYMKSGYVFTIVIGGTSYTIGYNDVKGYVNISRSQTNAGDTNITLTEEWKPDMAGNAEHMIITLVIGDTKTTDNISVSVGGMTEDTFTITKSTGPNCPDVEVKENPTAENGKYKLENGKYTIATSYTNATVNGNSVLQAVINVKAEYELISFEITENRYGDTTKTTTLFMLSEHLESIRNAGGTAITITETSGNTYHITLSVKYGPIEGESVNYYQCTFTFDKTLTFDAEFKTNIKMETYAVSLKNKVPALSNNDFVTIIGGAINEKSLSGGLSLRTLTKDDLATFLDEGYSIPAGSSLRVAMRINEKYMHDTDGFNNWTSTEYDVEFGEESGNNVIKYYYKSMYNNTIWGSNSSTEDVTNVIVIEIYNVSENTNIGTRFQEKSYGMTLSDNLPFGTLPSGLTSSWECNKEYADKENSKHTYSQIESGDITYTATLSEAYSKTGLSVTVTYKQVEENNGVSTSATVFNNKGFAAITTGTGASVVSVSINDKGEVTVTRHQMAYYDITVTFDAPEINKYSITLENIADNVDVVEYTPSTDEQGNIVHTYTLYKTDVIADSNSPDFSTMGILESQGAGIYRAKIGVFTINTCGKTVYYLNEYNKYVEFSDWTNLLNMGKNVQGEDSKKVVLYYEHVTDSQNIEFEFKTENSAFGFKRLVTDNVNTSGIIETQNKNILFSVNNGADAEGEKYYNCNIAYAKTFEPLIVSDYSKLSYGGNDGNGLPSQDHSSEIGGLSVYDKKENLLSVYNKDSGTYGLVSEYFKYSKVVFNLGAQYVDALTEEINGTKYLNSEFINVNCGVLGTFRLHQDGVELADATGNKYFRYIAEFSYWTGATITIDEDRLKPALYNYMLDYIANENDNICDNAKYLGYNNTTIDYVDHKIVIITDIMYQNLVHLATITVTITGTNITDITGLSSIYQLSSDGKDQEITKDNFKGFGNLIRVPYGTNIEVKIEINSETASQNMSEWSIPYYYVTGDNFKKVVTDYLGSWQNGNNVDNIFAPNSTTYVGVYKINNIISDIGTREFAFNLHRNAYEFRVPESLFDADGNSLIEANNLSFMFRCKHYAESKKTIGDKKYVVYKYGYNDSVCLQLRKGVTFSNVDYAKYNDPTSGIKPGYFKTDKDFFNGVFYLQYDNEIVVERNGKSETIIIERGNNAELKNNGLSGFIVRDYIARENCTLIDNRKLENRYSLTFTADNLYEGVRQLILTNTGAKAVKLTFYNGTDYNSDILSGSITIDSGKAATINVDNIVKNKYSVTAGKLYFAVTGDDVVFGSEFANIKATIVQTFSAKYTQALGKYSVGNASNISLGEFGDKLNVSDISNTPIKRSMTVDIQVDYVKDYYFSALGVNSYTTHIDTKNMSIVEGADADPISGYKLTLEDGVSTIIKLQAGDNYSRATEFVMYHKNTDNTIGTKYTISYDSNSNRWLFNIVDGNRYPAYYDVNNNKWYSGESGSELGDHFDSAYFTIYSITMPQNSNGVFVMEIALNSSVNDKIINIEIEDNQINEETLQFRADNSNDDLDNVDKMFSKIDLMVWNSVGLVGNTSYGDGGSSVSDFFTTSSFTLPVDATISLHLTLAEGYYNIDKLTINGIVDAIAGDYDGNFTIGSVDYNTESHILVYTFSNIKNFTFVFAQDLRDSYVFGVSSNDFNAYASGISTTCSEDDKYKLNIINMSGKPHGNYFELVIFHTSDIAFSFTIDKSYTLSSVNGTSLTSKGDDKMGCTIGSWDVSYNTIDNKVTISGAVKKGETFNIVFEKRTTTFTLNYLDTDYRIKTTEINLTYGQTIKEAILIALKSVGESLTSLGFSESDLLPKTTGLKYVGFTFFGEDIVNGDTTYTHVVRKTDTSGNLLYPYTFETFAGNNNMYVGNYSNINFVNKQYMIIYSNINNASLPIVSPDCTIDDEGSARFKILSSNSNIGVIYAYVDQTVTLNYNREITKDEDQISDMTITYSFADYSHVFFLNNNIELDTGVVKITDDSEYIISHKARPYQAVNKFVDIYEKYEWQCTTLDNGAGKKTTPIFQSKETDGLKQKIELLKALNYLAVYDAPGIILYAQYVDTPMVIDFLDESKTLAIENVISGYTGVQKVVESDSGQEYDSVYFQSSNGNKYLYYLFNVFGSNNNRYSWRVGETTAQLTGDNTLSVSEDMYLKYLPTKLKLGATSNGKRIVDYVLCTESDGSFTSTKYKWSSYTNLRDMFIAYWNSLDKNTTGLLSKYNLTLKVEMGNPVSVIFDVSDEKALSGITAANGDLKFTFYSGSQDVYALIRQYINDESKDQYKRNILAKYFMIPNDDDVSYINGYANKKSTVSCDYAVIGTTQGDGSKYLSSNILDIDSAVADNVTTLVLHIANSRGGDENNPFIIDDAYSWNKILLNNMSGGKYFIQTADLNLTELSRSQQNETFTGHYLGGTIDGRSVKLIRTAQDPATSNDIYPIFSSITGDSSVENVEIVGDVTNPKYHPSETITGDSWGSLAGKIGEGSTISKITTSGGINLNIYSTCYGNIGSIVGKWDYKVSSPLFSTYINSLTANNAIHVSNVAVKYLGGVVGLLNIVSSDEGLTFKDIVNNGTITTENVSEGYSILRTAGVANIVLNKGSELIFDNVANNGNDEDNGKIMSISTQNGTVSGIANIEVLATDSPIIHFDNIVNNVNIVADCGSLSSSAIVAGVMTIVGNDNSGKTIITYDNLLNNGSITVNSSSTNKAAIAGGLLLQNAKIEVDEFNQTNSSKIKNSGNLSGADYSAGAMIMRGGSDIPTAFGLRFENSGQVTGNKLASGGLLITENNSKSITGTINISNSTNSGNITATMLAGGIMASYYDQKSVKIGIGSTNNTTKGVINSGAISAGSGYGAGIYSVYAAQKDSSNAEVSCTAEIINVENLGVVTGKYVAGIVQGVYQANTKWCINGDGTTITLEDGTTVIKGSVTSTDGVAGGIAVVRRSITDQGSANNASISATTTSNNIKTIATGIVAVCAWDNGVISLNSSSNSKPSTANSIITSSGYASGVAYINGVTNANYTAYISACANSQAISGKIASGILVVDSDTLGDRVFDIGENGNTTNSGAITGTLLASGISGYIQGDGLTNLITFNLKQAVTTDLGLKFIQVQTAYSNAYAAGIAVAIGGFVNQINGKIVNVKQVYVDSPSGGDCIAMVAGLVVAKYANIISGDNGINDSPTAKVFALVPVIYGDEDVDGNQTIKQGALVTGGVIAYNVNAEKTYNIKGVTNICSIGLGYSGEIIKTGIYIVGGSNYTISGNKYTGTDLTGVRERQTGVDLSNLPEDWYLSIGF